MEKCDDDTQIRWKKAMEKKRVEKGGQGEESRMVIKLK